MNVIQLPVMQKAVSAASTQQKRQAAPRFGVTVKFGADGEPTKRSMTGFFKRFWKMVWNRGHSKLDEMSRNDPAAFREARDNAVKKVRDAQNKMARIIGLYKVAKDDLAKLEQALKKEELERDAAAEVLEQVEAEKGATSAEYEQVYKIVNDEIHQVEMAQLKVDSKKAEVKQAEAESENAKMLMKEADAQLAEIIKALEKAEHNQQKAQSLEELVKIRQQLQVAAGEKVGMTDEIGAKIREQEVRVATAEAQLLDGKSSDEQLAAIRAKQAVKDRTAKNDVAKFLAERKAKREGTAVATEQKAASASSSGTSAPAVTSPANPLDEKTS